MLAIITAGALFAQQKEGRVVYERTSQFTFRAPGMNDDVPRSRTDKFELLFGNDQSLWRNVPASENENVVIPDGGGMFRMRMMGGGADDVVYTSLSDKKRIESREILDRTFIIEDSLSKLKWKMTDESKTILGVNTRKATATQISSRMSMQMVNGAMERQTVPDTLNIVAWFAPTIPVAAGPQYQGQLPGLILELSINNDRTVYKAVEFSPKADVAEIKAPKGKKKYTQAEFEKERDALFEEMRKNGGGRNMIIRQ